MIKKENFLFLKKFLYFVKIINRGIKAISIKNTLLNTAKIEVITIFLSSYVNSFLRLFVFKYIIIVKKK
jgi:hypothetical protein